VGLIMLYMSYDISSRAAGVLLDMAPDRRVIEAIEKSIRKSPEVTSFHKLKARYSGNRLFVDVHLRFDPAKSIDETHALGHRVKVQIIEDSPIVEEVNIHLEPEPALGGYIQDDKTRKA